jgi:hypothetical protein
VGRGARARLLGVRLAPEWIEQDPVRVSLPGELLPIGLSPEELGEQYDVPAVIWTEIDEWDRQFQDAYQPDDPAESGFPDEAAMDRWVERGMRVARRLARELGPSVPVEITTSLGTVRVDPAGDLYAKVFVKWSGDADALAGAVAAIIDGRAVRRSVTSAVLDLDVEENDDRDDEVGAGDPDRLLRFPFYLDVEPAAPDVSGSEVVVAVSALSVGLAEAGAECAAAADHEDQLPGGGHTGPASGEVPGH